MKTVAIVQGRMASSRLPDKILKDIGGKPMLAWVVDQARKARRIDQVVVATTREASDDPVEAYCQASGIPCYRGSMHGRSGPVLPGGQAFSGRRGGAFHCRLPPD